MINFIQILCNIKPLTPLLANAIFKARYIFKYSDFTLDNKIVLIHAWK
ncbi:MAG: hypothetical protein M1576_01355 [Deltaproteobacteria bacterium]|nr:hypothetical protein [Deltaproteobacteria bacterium]